MDTTALEPGIEPTSHDAHDEPDTGIRTRLIELDPREIVVNVRNPRERARRIEELKDSIAQIGLLDPIVVFVNAEGAFELKDGFRRRTACIELDMPLVECRLVDTEGDAEQIVAMLASALHRDDLTVSEEARGYEQLTLLDWEPEAIAQVVAKPVTRVKQALALTKMPEKAKKAVDGGALPLDQLAALEELAGDPELLGKVLDKGADSPWRWKHVIADTTRRRDRKAAADKLRAELTLAGVKLISRPKDFPYSSKAARVEHLRDADGNRLVPDEVKARAGFAAFVDGTDSVPRATIVCLDPEAMGYTRTGYSSYESPEELAEKERLARERQEQIEALTAAEEVRREFVRSTYRSAKTIKNLFVEVLRDAVIDPYSIVVGRSTTAQEILASFAGGPLLPDAHKAGQDRLSRMLVARWLTCHETRLTGGRVAYSDRAKVVAYLDRLTTDGYSLSDAETQLKADIETALADEAAAEARDAEEEATDDSDDVEDTDDTQAAE